MTKIFKLNEKFSSSSRRWLIRQQNDPYVKRAVSDGYRSRAAYKLQEIDNKFHIIKNSAKIIDLGAAPGGWSQVLAQRSSPETRIAAVDLLKFALVDEKVHQFFGDFENENLQKEITDFLGGSVDLIVSDMSPATVGHRQSDHWRIMRLVESVYSFSQKILKDGGSFVVKIFHGEDEKPFFQKLQKDFYIAKFFKPSSSRNESTEIYVLGMKYRKSRNLSW